MPAKRRRRPRAVKAGAGVATPPALVTGPTVTGRPWLAAADFYAALQKSLDALQRQLSNANNPFADFVVKDFNIDAAVQIRINPLGVLQLSFADDAMAAQSVSRISLTLAAVAKAPPADGAAPVASIADSVPLSDVPWLPRALTAQLAENDIKTAAEFLGLVADARLTSQVVSMLKVKRAELGLWADQTRLLDLPGMTIRYVQILGDNGIRSIAALAALSQKALAELTRNTAALLPGPLLTSWHEAAKVYANA